MLDVLLECIFLGTVDAVASARVPMFLRVTLAVVLLTVCLGLFALLLTVGIGLGSVMLIALACVILCAMAFVTVAKVKRLFSKN